MNNVSLIGNISTDLFPRETANGTQTVWFKVAVDGESKDAPTDFIPVKAWNGTAKACIDWLTKGDRVAITGRVSSSRRDNGDGTFTDFFEVSARRVEFLRTKKGADAQGASEDPAGAGPPPEAAETTAPAPTESAAPTAQAGDGEDGIPF